MHRRINQPDINITVHDCSYSHQESHSDTNQYKFSFLPDQHRLYFKIQMFQEYIIKNIY